jgi:hypothetical protein
MSSKILFLLEVFNIKHQKKESSEKQRQLPPYLYPAADFGIQVAIYDIGVSIPVAGWIVGGSYFI